MNPEPDSFDIRRKDIRHQSFGGNKHLCLGAHLARVETQEAILALIQRFPKLSLVEQEFDYRPVPSFRALIQLWVSREESLLPHGQYPSTRYVDPNIEGS